MRPWFSDRRERERGRQGETRRIPLFVEPDPLPGSEAEPPARPAEEHRGWCVIDDCVDTVIEGF